MTAWEVTPGRPEASRREHETCAMLIVAEYGMYMYCLYTYDMVPPYKERDVPMNSGGSIFAYGPYGVLVWLTLHPAFSSG